MAFSVSVNKKRIEGEINISFIRFLPENHQFSFCFWLGVAVADPSATDTGHGKAISNMGQHIRATPEVAKVLLETAGKYAWDHVELHVSEGEDTDQR